MITIRKGTRELEVQQKKLDGKEGMLNSVWTDGIDYYQLWSPDDNTRYRFARNGQMAKSKVRLTYNGTGDLAVTGMGQGVTKARIYTFNEVKMLQFLDGQGKVKELYISCEHQHPGDHTETLMCHLWYDGLYLSRDSTYAVMGIKHDHYKVPRYEEDPGPFAAQVIQGDSSVFTHQLVYGDGRVSRGNPSSPTYGQKMPGAGGAAALMGPMMWEIQPTDAGFAALVEEDQPRVDHYPYFARGVHQFRRIATPYADELPGRWPIVSLHPLPTGMLKRLTRDGLQEMRKEVMSRSRQQLTPIEKLNVQLIDNVLKTKRE